MEFRQKKGGFKRLALGFFLYFFILVTYTTLIYGQEVSEEPVKSVFWWTVLASLVCTYVLYWIFDKRIAKEQGLKSGVLIGYIITFLVLVAVGYGYDVYHQSKTETIVECPSADRCNVFQHIHTYVDIYTCGDSQSYHFPVQAGGAALQHTHHEENRVHWHEKLLLNPDTLSLEDSEKHKRQLGDFFDRTETSFTDADGKICVNGKCDGETCPDGKEGKWIISVDGALSNQWRDYIWRDEEHVKIEYTTDETAINAWKTQAKTLHPAEETFTKFPVTLGVVIGFSAVDSINPCAFGVLIFLITYLLKSGKRKIDLLIHGFIYIAFVYITYISAGFILLTLITQFQSAFQAFSNFFYYLLAIVVILFGLMELRDYIQDKLHPGEYHAVMAIRPKMKEKIEQITYKIVDRKSTSAFLGFFVSMVELPCTGAVYLAILAAMAFEGFTVKNVVFLIIYNVIFVLPLVAILLLAYKGMSTFEFKRWYIKNKGFMRILTAVVLVGMGVWLLQSVGFFTIVGQWMRIPGAWKILLAIVIAAFLLTAWEIHHARSKRREATLDQSHDPHVAAYEHHEQVTALQTRPEQLEDKHDELQEAVDSLGKEEIPDQPKTEESAQPMPKKASTKKRQAPKKTAKKTAKKVKPKKATAKSKAKPSSAKKRRN